MADEEVERIEQKRLRGDVLDPIALTDPLGKSVEQVIMRVGITVVAILITGILLAQVACKNIQLSAVPDLANGVNETVVENALEHGITWSGDIVRFPSVEFVDIDQANGVVTVEETAVSARTLEAVVSDAIPQSTALAMNVFRDAEINQLVYIVKTHVSEETGMFSKVASDPVDEAFRIVWTRGEQGDPELAMRLEGAALLDVLQDRTAKIDETPGVQLG